MTTSILYRSRISKAKYREIVKLFLIDLTAKQIASLTGLNIKTVNRFLRLIREAIAKHCENRHR